MTITADKKNEIIGKFGKTPKNTGTASVQVALITERIKFISDHLKSHKKDYTSQVGLLKLVGQRRRLLNYIKRHDLAEYAKVIQQLDLRK